MKFYDKTFEIIKNTNVLQNNFHIFNKNYSSIIKKNRTNYLIKIKWETFYQGK